MHADLYDTEFQANHYLSVHLQKSAFRFLLSTDIIGTSLMWYVKTKSAWGCKNKALPTKVESLIWLVRMVTNITLQSSALEW